MNKNDVLSCLCYHDPRNPNYCDEDFEEEPNTYNPQKECYCDNCFHGKTKLALELLKYIKG